MHNLFPGFVSLLCKNLAHCLFYSFLGHGLFLVCWFVTQESHALFLLQFACLLRKNLARYFFCSLFISYARISCTVSSVVCLSVTPKSRAPFLLWFVGLLRKSLVYCFLCKLLVSHARISRTIYSLGLLVCCARISRTVSSIVFLSIMQESRALFLL